MASAVEILKNDDSILITEFNPEPPKIVSFEGSVSRQNSNLSCELVGQELVNEVQNIDHDVCEAGEEDSFFVADLGEVARAYKLWTEKLPNVRAHYAVKCNTDRNVVRLLGHLGANLIALPSKKLTPSWRLVSMLLASSMLTHVRPTPSFVTLELMRST